jgi:hypothetical protein
MPLTSHVHCRSKAHIVSKKVLKRFIKNIKSSGLSPLTKFKTKKETNHKCGWFYYQDKKKLVHTRSKRDLYESVQIPKKLNLSY